MRTLARDAKHKRGNVTGLFLSVPAAQSKTFIYLSRRGRARLIYS